MTLSLTFLYLYYTNFSHFYTNCIATMNVVKVVQAGIAVVGAGFDCFLNLNLLYNYSIIESVDNNR